MQIKKIATLTSLLVATTLLSGCSLSREIASLDMYAPSDGTMVDVETLKARNVMFIKGSGNKVMLIGSFVNSGMEPVMASIQTKDASGEDIRVAVHAQGRGLGHIDRVVPCACGQLYHAHHHIGGHLRAGQARASVVVETHDLIQSTTIDGL